MLTRHTGGVPIAPLRWDPVGPAVVLLDQTRLPADEVELRCADVPDLVEAIRGLAVRGAPLLGIAGAYGVALAAARGDDVAAQAEVLAAARPTAVNLATGVQHALGAWRDAGGGPAAPLAAARALQAADRAASAAIADVGLPLVPSDARVLTHCNTGALVSGGEGTALGLAFAAHRAGRLRQLWVGETRPLLQGARLTAWEAERAGVPYAVVPDGAAGSLFARGLVDVVLVGADRIAADGSVANKVGTYGLAVLAARHDVPFVVVAPVSTIDPATPDGSAIVIEERPAAEVTTYAGRQVAPAGAPAYNPAFDVTPPDLVAALVTECGIASPVTRAALAALLAPSATADSGIGATMKA
jgi:methylthioribose-1-phosphate isomerase